MGREESDDTVDHEIVSDTCQNFKLFRFHPTDPGLNQKSHRDVNPLYLIQF